MSVTNELCHCQAIKGDSRDDADFCSHLEYDGHGKLHINTIMAFIKKEFGVRKMKDIPQSRFTEALELIQDFDLYTDKIEIRDRLSERN